MLGGGSGSGISNNSSSSARLSRVGVVDHTYRDFSCYLQPGLQLDRHKKAETNFPAKLHQMLSDPHFANVIIWMPHGRAWKILNKELLMSNIHKYFALKRFHSFIRQLSGWGFKRLHQPGPDHGCYYHECFLRGIPRLTWLMRRVPTNTGKPVPHIEGEPDFYEIAKTHPVPPTPTSCGGLAQSFGTMMTMTANGVPAMGSTASSISIIPPPAALETACQECDPASFSLIFPHEQSGVDDSVMNSSTFIDRDSTYYPVATQDSDAVEFHHPSPPFQMTNTLPRYQHPSPNHLLPSSPFNNYQTHPCHVDNNTVHHPLPQLRRPGMDGPLPPPRSYTPYDANHLYPHDEYSHTSFHGQHEHRLNSSIAHNLLVEQLQQGRDQSKEQEQDTPQQGTAEEGKRNEFSFGHQLYSLTLQDHSNEEESGNNDDFSRFSWT